METIKSSILQRTVSKCTPCGIAAIQTVQYANAVSTIISSIRFAKYARLIAWQQAALLRRRYYCVYCYIYHIVVAINSTVISIPRYHLLLRWYLQFNARSLSVDIWQNTSASLSLSVSIFFVLDWWNKNIYKTRRNAKFTAQSTHYGSIFEERIAQKMLKCARW